MGQAFRKLFDAFFGTSEMRVPMSRKVQYKNVMFTVWDIGGQEKLRPTDGLISVVDSLDRKRIGKAKAEFQKGAMTPMQVCEGLGLYDLKNRIWHIQGSCALKGDGVYMRASTDWQAP